MWRNVICNSREHLLYILYLPDDDQIKWSKHVIFNKINWMLYILCCVRRNKGNRIEHTINLLKIGENVIPEPQYIAEAFADNFCSVSNSSSSVAIPNIFNICFWTVLTMADNTRNYWVFILRLSSSTPQNTTFRRLIFFRPQMKGWNAPARFGPLEKSNVSYFLDFY
jgi:hypothetical protein